MVIQRSWKILSEPGINGSSAPIGDVQQRSPAALQHPNSSSDDSDCSNQTTHSMDTRVASPLITNAEDLKKTTESAITETKLMLPVLCETTEPAIKYVTTSEMAENMLQRIRQRLSGAQHLESSGSAESAMRALELLRISVQRSFDLEVSDIIKRYMNEYFKPAFGNIKENLGQNAINEEILQKMSCALLENAKSQYTNFSCRQQRQHMAATEQQRVALKRPASKLNTNDANVKIYTNNLGYVVKPLACAATQVTATTNTMPALVQQVQQQHLQQQPLQSQQQLLQQVQQQQQQHGSLAPIMGGTLPTPVRRQIFWNTAQISTSTKFVLDVQANVAFGFGSDGKERLASKHPELIRYLPDGEDRNWMAARGIIPVENRSSRFLFLIFDEVCRLQQTHEQYRLKTSIDLSMMLTFSVTEPMIQKMKLFFVDLNIKSRGLITNSFIATNSQQQPQSQQQCSNNSHLRNALLQGQQQTQQPQQSQIVQAEQQLLKELPTVSTTTCLQGTAVGSTTTPQKTKLSNSSALSSTHATLTALLNNSHNGSSSGTSNTPSNNKFRT